MNVAPPAVVRAATRDDARALVAIDLVNAVGWGGHCFGRPWPRRLVEVDDGLMGRRLP